MGHDHDACDTVLVLGLGNDGTSRHRPKQEPKLDPFLFPSSPDSFLGPSLTLGIPDVTSSKKVEAKKAASCEDQQSAGSSSSNGASCLPGVKRERVDVCGGDQEEEAERVTSSRVSDEDEEGSVRKKLRLTKEQSALLEERFKEHSTLNPKQKLALAKQLNLRPRQVEVWFQNRRARTKLKQTEVDCEFLKRCCETLTDENRRLNKELQELKAIKFAASPLYMQIPTAAAATLTMCPSCERIGGPNGVDGGRAGSGGGAALQVVAQKTPHFYYPFSRPSPSAAC